jgi:hypothetical protein
MIGHVNNLQKQKVLKLICILSYCSWQQSIHSYKKHYSNVSLFSKYFEKKESGFFNRINKGIIRTYLKERLLIFFPVSLIVSMFDFNEGRKVEVTTKPECIKIL